MLPERAEEVSVVAPAPSRVPEAIASSAVVSALAALVGTGLLDGGILTFLAAFFMAWVLGGATLAALLPALGPAGEEPDWEGAAAETHDPFALQQDEERIGERVREIDAQRARIDHLRTLVEGEGAVPALAMVRERLEYAGGVLNEQRARHQAQLWVISLARWQHRLAQVTADVTAAGRHDVRTRLDALTAATQDGKALLREWEAQEDTAATREGRRCVLHLRDLLHRSEPLRQAVLVREAMLAIRGIAPSDDAERTAALSTEPLESLQTDLGEGGSLARALADLEMEHERLQDDHEEARDVERFLGELESEHSS
jgi:DNA repair exonuclease SbcCD ATPase subunit